MVINNFNYNSMVILYCNFKVMFANNFNFIKEYSSYINFDIIIIIILITVINIFKYYINHFNNLVLLNYMYDYINFIVM